MAWTLFPLGLIAYGSGADSQTMVIQDLSLSVSPRGTVTLTCGLSSGSVSATNSPHWFQQTPCQDPCMLIYNISNLPSGISDCFSGSRSGNKVILTITMVEVEDEANYHCLLALSVSALETGEKLVVVMDTTTMGREARPPLPWFKAMCPPSWYSQCVSISPL
ncbi:unnamed protein product [Gulo gulo]|uniref:Ig-like domain-containing protein n=1 Tax=Gulo gulo TaxID=48420 RepID=A0A9X9PVJ7_GULGU|nr:unnamed protein product [Gulo gulo]